MNKQRFEKTQYYLLLILCSLFSTISFAQGYNTTSWKYSNPKQFGFAVTDMDYLDNNNVIAVGAGGGIAKSTDGGNNWTYGEFTYTNAAGAITTANFTDVHYLDANNVYAVGSPGLMIKSADGGATWNVVTTPFSGTSKNVDAVWFISKDTGYIGGQFLNMADSAARLYVTKNGGATWDSILPPNSAMSRYGYVANATYAPFVAPIPRKTSEIMRIEFVNRNLGYIAGYTGTGVNYFPPIPNVSATAPCNPSGTFTSNSGGAAAMLWKFSNGALIDYSVSKERIGETGIPTGTITCNSKFASGTGTTQVYKAMNIVNDSLVVIASFNNNYVARIRTGKGDSTLNAVTGLYENGKYEMFTQATTGILVSNPLQIRKATNGNLFTIGAASAFAGTPSLIWNSADTGKTWTQRGGISSTKNYYAFSINAFDINAAGKILAAGSLGLVADSTSGSAWHSNYNVVAPGAGYNKIEWVDCNNAIATGSSYITSTSDGGVTWNDYNRPDIAANFNNIAGLAYPTIDKAYIACNNGIVYASTDKGATLYPALVNTDYQMLDVAAIGKDTAWAVGYNATTVPAASRTSAVFRTYNGGTTWTTVNQFPVGSTVSVSLTEIEMPTKLVGYACGARDTIYKTIDGGTTWTKLPLPTPGVTPQITYTMMYALDANTVFVVGNGFPRRVIYKSLDGGNTWTEITNNLATLYPSGNVNGVLFHDANNGYVGFVGGVLAKTNNGGASWTVDVAPLASSTTQSSSMDGLAFNPRTVPAGTTMANRKLSVVGVLSPGIMEYGTAANVAVNSTETVVGTTCSTIAGGSITVNAIGAIAPYQYSINGGAFQSSNVFSGLTQGTKTITIKDAYCGTLTKTVSVGFTDNLTLTASNDTTVCANAPVLLTAISAGASFAWTPTTGLTNATISNPVATVPTSAAYTVTASLNGCVRTKQVNINVKPSPAVDAGLDRTIVSGDVITLQGNGPSNTQSIIWTPTTGIASGVNTYTPIVQPATTTTYTLTMKDVNNCVSTDNAIVTVIPYCVKIMNAFTPNGDGINDKWIVTSGGSCTTQVLVKVFNRYGDVVYSNENYQNDWTGTYKGKPVPDGTYYYATTLRLINGNVVVLKGDVTILR